MNRKLINFKIFHKYIMNRKFNIIKWILFFFNIFNHFSIIYFYLFIYSMRNKIFFFSTLRIEFYSTNKFTKIIKFYSLWFNIHFMIKLKTKCTCWYNIKALYIFYFYNNRQIKLENIFLDAKKEIINCQYWRRDTLANLLYLFSF